VVVGLLALMAAMALAIELLVRAAAVYVVVLMLPLAFAAMVWPARRVWTVRLVELLASLILSKFVIVAVLSLASAAFTHGTPGTGELLVAMSLMLLSTFAPWALMRILPFTELAAGAAGILRTELPHAQARAAAGDLAAGTGEMAMDLPARLREHARAMYARNGAGADPETSTAATAVAQPRGRSSGEQPAGSEQPVAGGPSSVSGRSPQPQATVDQPGTPQPGDEQRGGRHSSTPDAPVDTREPFVLAEPWRRDHALALDSQLPPPQPPAGQPNAHHADLAATAAEHPGDAE
jgi:hypothetical protein